MHLCMSQWHLCICRFYTMIRPPLEIYAGWTRLTCLNVIKLLGRYVCRILSCYRVTSAQGIVDKFNSSEFEIHLNWNSVETSPLSVEPHQHTVTRLWRSISTFHLSCFPFRIQNTHQNNILPPSFKPICFSQRGFLHEPTDSRWLVVPVMGRLRKGKNKWLTLARILSKLFRCHRM